MTCYNEQTCSSEFFQTHIQDNPKNICVKSQVAGLCGLDLKLIFHQHSPFHHARREDYKSYKPMCTNVNGVATLLTFDPETGYYNHLVLGKAYVILNDGVTPLSKEQIWGLQELIAQAKTLYHKDHKHISDEAHQELLTMVAQYQAGTWAPPSIYEPRHSYKPVLYRFESGVSDQATCHHGCTHVHHDGHHKCCHNDNDDDNDRHGGKLDAWDTVAWEEEGEDSLEAREPDNHHIVVARQDTSRNARPLRQSRITFKLPRIFATGCH